MKAVGFSKHGGPEVLQWIDLPEPKPGADEVVIRTEVIGVNFADIYRRRGEYPSEPPSPYVLGHEAAGTIHSLGTDVRTFSVGDRVAFAHVPRANAEFVKAAAWKVIPLPRDISFETAAAVLLQGLTAHYLTHDSYKLTKEDTVLIHAASGGVGQLLLQICQILGAQTIGTVSNPDKVQSAKDAGANHVIVRSDGDWQKMVLEITNGAGVNVAYDAIGSTLETTLSVVRPHGSVVYFGWAGGMPPKIDPHILMEDSKTLVGGELWSHISTRQALLERSKTLFTWLSEGRMRPQIFGRYSLSQTSEAHRVLESGSTIGKVLLTVC